MNEFVKQKVKETYGKIALIGNTESCCMPYSSCCNQGSTAQSAKIIGYDAKDLEDIPQSSILGLGCGSPISFANIEIGETIVDLGSGAGVDVFIAAKKAGDSAHVIGIDMTDQMLEKAKRNAKENGYNTVEFRNGDIEKEIPVESSSVDLVLSNCVINLTTNKESVFREIYRILKNGGRMVISDLIADKEIPVHIDLEKWCSCIDGALTKEKYLEIIRQAGFNRIQILKESIYQEGIQIANTKIKSVVIKAVKR